MSEPDKVIEIRVYDPENPAYEGIDSQKAKATRNPESTRYYNSVIETFNDLPIDAIMVFPCSHHGGKTSNFHRVMRVRGLVQGEDYEFGRIFEDDEGNKFGVNERPFKVKRISSKEGRLVED